MYHLKFMLPVFIGLISVLMGCNKETPLRNESIFVFDQSKPETEIELLDVNYQGTKGAICIKSNVDYDVEFQQDVHNHDLDWITFSPKRYDEALGCDIIEYEAKPMEKSLQRLNGILNITSKENFYGKFIVVRQGFNARYGTDFSFLKFGSKDPLVSGNERAFEFWYDEQKENNPFETTVIPGQPSSHFYGRNGYVQLGNDEGYGAQVTIPYVKEIRRDSAVVVAFNALAMPEDNAEITLEILGGGVFDGTKDTKRVFKAPGFSTDTESIWDNSLKSWVISSLPENKITTETRIRITAGKLEKMDKNNRILLDNIYVFSLPKEAYDTVLAEGAK